MPDAPETSALPDQYVTALPVSALFTDPEYQRELDVNRSRRMARTWEPRLVGVLDVSDRGEDQDPRYAIINGQHRWAAARYVDDTMAVVCNVHTGLTPADEAKLFWDIDRQTKKLGTWDRWYARRAAGDPVVVEIEQIAGRFGFVLSHSAGDNHLQCCAALEWIHDRFAPETIADAIEITQDVWPGDGEAKKSPVLKGVAMVLGTYATDLNTGRLADALSEITPRQLQARGHDLKGRGTYGSLNRLIAMVIVHSYNRRSGPKLDDAQLVLP